jgi:hypothetical protein
VDGLDRRVGFSSSCLFRIVAVFAIALVLVLLHGTEELAVRVECFRIGRVEQSRMGRIALWILLVLGWRACSCASHVISGCMVVCMSALLCTAGSPSKMAISIPQPFHVRHCLSEIISSLSTTQASSTAVTCESIQPTKGTLLAKKMRCVYRFSCTARPRSVISGACLR